MINFSSPDDEPDTVGTRHLNLLTFVELMFMPLQREKTSPQYQSQLRSSVRRFNEFLGREAILADLNRKQTAHFFKWLKGAIANGTGETVGIRFRTIWRFIHELGLVEAPPGRTANNDAGIGKSYRKRIRKSQRTTPIRAQTPIAPGSIREYFETVYLPQRLVGASVEAIKEFRRKLERLDQWAKRPVTLADLSDTFLASFLNSRLELGLRRATVNGYRCCILAIWRLAFEQSLVSRLPSVKKLREAHDEPDSWNEEEFSAILASCKCLDRPNWIGILLPSQIMRAVLLMAYWTGLRRGSLWKLRWKDIDLENRWVTISGESMKGRRGKRLRFGEDAADALRQIQVSGRENVFPKMDWHCFYKWFDLVLKDANVSPSHRLRMTKLHKIRRTTATLLAKRQGVGAASTLLGHSDQQVTLRYIDPSKLSGQDMTHVLPELSSNTGGKT